MSRTTSLCLAGAIAGVIASACAASAERRDPFAGSYEAIDGQSFGEIRRSGPPGRYRVSLATFNPETGCDGSVEAVGVARGQALDLRAEAGGGPVCRMRFTRVGSRLHFSSAARCANQYSGVSCGFSGDYRRVPGRPAVARRR